MKKLVILLIAAIPVLGFAQTPRPNARPILGNVGKAYRTRHKRGLAYSYSGKHDVAIADYDQAIQLDPYVASPYNARGWAYLEMGDLDRALQDLNHAIELSPEFVRAYTNRARLFDKKNDLKSELADLEVLLRIEPTNQWARNQRDEVVRRIGAQNANPANKPAVSPPDAAHLY